MNDDDDDDEDAIPLILCMFLLTITEDKRVRGVRRRNRSEGSCGARPSAGDDGARPRRRTARGRRRHRARPPGTSAWTPSSASLAQSRACAWIWLGGSGTRFWPASPWDWARRRTRRAPRWTGTASDGTSAPTRAAATSWTGCGASG